MNGSTLMAFGPIASATCLRRAANSSRRFALSNKGAGGVIRIAVGGSAPLSPIARATGRIESETARVKTSATQKGRLLIMINLFKVVVAGDWAFHPAGKRAWCRYAW